jgi:hypothetical protein
MYQLNVNNNDRFIDRTKAVFDQLVNKIELTRIDDQDIDLNQVDEQSHEPGKENSIQEFEFKVPASVSIPLNLANLNLEERNVKVVASCLPDYVINPDKWKKYSLEDVPESHMSASANFQAALSFLNKTKDDIIQLDQTKLCFNRPIGSSGSRKKNRSFLRIENKLLENLVEEQCEGDVELDSEAVRIQVSTDDDNMFKKRNTTNKNRRPRSFSKLDDLEENDSKLETDVEMIANVNNDESENDEIDSARFNYNNEEEEADNDGVDTNDYLN